MKLVEHPRNYNGSHYLGPYKIVGKGLVHVQMAPNMSVALTINSGTTYDTVVGLEKEEVLRLIEDVRNLLEAN